MSEAIFGWVKDIVFYLILITVLMNLLPGNKYRKYVRLFTGMLLIIIVIKPFGRFIKLDGIFDVSYAARAYEQEVGALAVDLEQAQEKQQEEFLGEYEKVIKERIEQTAATQNLQVLDVRLELVSEKSDSRYLYPKRMDLVVSPGVKNSIAGGIGIARIEIKERKEQNAQAKNLTGMLADFYNIEEADINIIVQE